jgi:hypothetical protein
MRTNSSRLLMLLVCLPLLTPLAGCFFATDLVNPGVLAAVGLDPATIIPPQGSVVIAFQNSTQFPADFSAAILDDILAEDADFFVVSGTGVGANETRTMVVDCPVGDVQPGSAFVAVDGTILEVPYAGSPLSTGAEFICGDVIQIRLVQIAVSADTVGFMLEVQILAGR